MKRNWFSFATRLSGIHSRAYIGVIVVSFVVLGLSGWQALQNRINGDITALLPKDAPSAQSLDFISKNFGATNTLILLYHAPPDVDLAPVLEKAASSLEKSDYVRRVDYRWAVADLEEHGLYYLEVEDLEKIRDDINARIREEIKKNDPFYVDLGDDDEEETDELSEEDFADFGKLVEQYGEGLALEGDYVWFKKNVDCPEAGTRDAQCKNVVWGMIVTPSEGAADVTYAKKLMDDVDERLTAMNMPDSVKVFKSGRYNYLASEANFVLGDLRRVSAIGAVLVAIVVFVFFPNPFILLLIFIPLIIGIAVDFGIVHLTIGELNLVTTANFAILFGMGVAYGVHVYSRFREETKRGHAYVEAMVSAVGDTGRAAFLAASTTAIAFFSLMLAEYKGFSQLGFITCLGVVFAFLAALIIMPALGKPLSRFKLIRQHKVTGSTIDDVLKRRGLPPRLYIPVVILGIILTLLSIWGMLGFDEYYETDYNKLQFQSEERELAHKYEKALFGWTGDPAVLSATSEDDLRQLVAQLEELRLGAGAEHIDGVDSILSFVPPDQEAKHVVIEEIAEIVNQKKMDRAEGEMKEQLDRLRKLVKPDPLTIDTLPEDIRMKFTSDAGGFLVFVYPKKDLNDIRYAIQLRKLLSARALGREYGGTSAAIIFGDIQDIMLKDSPRVIALTFLVVMLIVLIDFRSVRLTMLALVPLVLGMTWMVGIMSAFELKVNWVNVVAFPAVIGIGVDNGVHVLHRYRMEGPASLRRIIRNLGRTLTVSTLTTVMGFGALLLSHHPGLRTLGLLTVIGLITTFLAAVFFLPSVLFIYERMMSRHTLEKQTDFTLWTVAHDPISRRILRQLNARKVDYKIITLDEMPPMVMKEAMADLRKRTDGPLRFPILQKGDRLVATTFENLPEVRGLVDAP